jgi:hypothetical protein
MSASSGGTSSFLAAEEGRRLRSRSLVRRSHRVTLATAATATRSFLCSEVQCSVVRNRVSPEVDAATATGPDDIEDTVRGVAQVLLRHAHPAAGIRPSPL